ncbi:hypothetical protein E2562_028954 [Oryza meyeriana var. granulata]|uniref:Uncharacterized protein n=1 Tax=Oryza meyeriana var. granulata TaxID=110450 RepID=A0A6G1DQH8_9ORYZ|nr:hypothetical protein E2562_028954 [Oryza meyeriana var. granulata]
MKGMHLGRDGHHLATVAGRRRRPRWGMVERDGFSVEDLLDLEEFCEADKDGAEEHGQAPVIAAPEEKPKDDSY